MGQKQKIHAEANTENTSGSHDVGRPSAAPHHMVAAPSCDASCGPLEFVSICLRMNFLLLPHIVFAAFAHVVFSACGPCCIFCCLFYQLHDRNRLADPAQSSAQYQTKNLPAAGLPAAGGRHACRLCQTRLSAQAEALNQGFVAGLVFAL